MHIPYFQCTNDNVHSTFLQDSELWTNFVVKRLLKHDNLYLSPKHFIAYFKMEAASLKSKTEQQFNRLMEQLADLESIKECVSNFCWYFLIKLLILHILTSDHDCL